MNKEMNKEINKEIYKNNPRFELVDANDNPLGPRPFDYIKINDKYFLELCNPWFSTTGFCETSADMYHKVFGDIGIRIEVRELGDAYAWAIVDWLDKKYLDEFVAVIKATDPSEYHGLSLKYEDKVYDAFKEATKHLSKKEFRKMFQSYDDWVDDYDDDDYDDCNEDYYEEEEE